MQRYINILFISVFDRCLIVSLTSLGVRVDPVDQLLLWVVTELASDAQLLVDVHDALNACNRNDGGHKGQLAATGPQPAHPLRQTTDHPLRQATDHPLTQATDHPLRQTDHPLRQTDHPLRQTTH